MGPRLFGGIVYGWSNVFSAHDYFFWVPIIGPIVGAILGVWIYEGFIWIVKRYGHFPDIKDSDADSKDKQRKDIESLELQKKLTDGDA